MVAFDVGVLAGALIGAMWASNTLVAYPEVQAAGLQKNRAVSAAVSAGVVADLLSLTVLALATSTVLPTGVTMPRPVTTTLLPFKVVTPQATGAIG